MTVGNGDKLNGTLGPDNGSTELVNGFADQRFMISKYKLHILIHTHYIGANWQCSGMH